jgi:hypothetical protein
MSNKRVDGERITSTPRAPSSDSMTASPNNFAFNLIRLALDGR